MKSKITNNQEIDDNLEDIDESEIDIQPIGPSISTGKKGKLFLIIISAALISFVIYIFFFSGDGQVVQNIEPVFIAKPKNVAESETGLSPFELEEGYDLIGEEEASGLIEAPPVPEIPVLPGMPDSDDDSDISKIIDEAELQNQQKDQEKKANITKNEAKSPNNDISIFLKNSCDIYLP